MDEGKPKSIRELSEQFFSKTLNCSQNASSSRLTSKKYMSPVSLVFYTIKTVSVVLKLNYSKFTHYCEGCKPVFFRGINKMQ